MFKPRVKVAHRPIRRPDGKIWIGSLHYGLGTELNDETGLVWPVCQRMDGSLTRDELIACVAAECETEAALVEEVVDFLIGSGWVEDSGAVLPAELSEREIRRYVRSAQFQSWIDTAPRSSPYELQARLKASRVAVLGVGGVGSAVASSLVASGVGQVHCVDCDEIELTNLNRQTLFSEADIGRRKVEVAVERLRALNRDVVVTGVEQTLSGPGDIAGAVRGCDAFALCADIPEQIESWANRAALQLRVPWVAGSYTGPMLAVATFIPGITGCRECLMDSAREQMEASGRGDLFSAGKIPGFNPVMAPTAQMTGHFAAMEVLFLLFGMKVQTAGRMIHRNFLDYDHQYYIEASPRPDCPACADTFVADAAVEGMTA